MNFFSHLVKTVTKLFYVGSLARRNKHAIVVHLCHPGSLQLVERYILTRTGRKIIGILGCMAVGVDFIEHQQHRFVSAATHIPQGLVDHSYLLLKIRMRDVDHMHQYIGFPHFVEGGFERIHQVRRQFADESYRVGQQEWQIIDYDLAYSSIECGEKFIFRKHIAFAQQVHQRGLTDICIADKSHACKLAAVLSLN